MSGIVLSSEIGVSADLTSPALPGARDLSALRPVVVIDSREQEPLHFERFQSVTGTLYSGDYSIAGLEDSFAVERKSIGDLVGCCVAAGRDRFEHELHRLRGYRFKRLLIVGERADIVTGRYHSRIRPKAVLATLGAFEVRYDLPVIFVASPLEAAASIERWVFWYSREVVKTARQFAARLSPE